ncbi:MAG: rod shape-determining protein MreC [Bacteroidota bacterium]
MTRLLYLLYVRSAFVTFALLEIASAWLITAQHVQERNWGYSNHRLVAACCALISKISAYPKLRSVNTALQCENALLREQLLQVTRRKIPTNAPAIPARYALVPARVINNTIVHTRNYLTLDKGAAHGLEPGMGVVGPKGIVGKIKMVSEQFSTVVPLLHIDVLTSAKLACSGVMGTVQWSGQDPFTVQLRYVPRHVVISPGEAVVTSGYNAVFFEGALIGYVKRATLRPEAPFYNIELSLSTDFSALQYVYVVTDKWKKQKAQLEYRTQMHYD